MGFQHTAEVTKHSHTAATARCRRREHAVRYHQARGAGCVFKECSTPVVQDHQMGRLCGPYTLAIWHQVVLDLDCWRGSRGHSRALRVPMENAGLDPTLGRLE